VERGDVHAPGFAQGHQGQERDEGLVEVEQVELLPLQHVLDLRPIAGGDGESPDGTVGRHREALPDPDDVALGAALQAVAGGQDPDVVAARAEALVEVADVVVDAAGSG
jgi:hypothetical protein